MSTEKISEQRIAEFQEAFSLYDEKNAGRLPLNHIGILMRSLGQTPTQKEVQAIVSEQETEGKSSFDFQDFLEIMAKHMKEAISEEEVIKAFRVFDKNNDGYIDAEQLRHIVTTTGERLTEEEAEEMIREGDVNGSGIIDYVSFARKLLSK